MDLEVNSVNLNLGLDRDLLFDILVIYYKVHTQKSFYLLGFSLGPQTSVFKDSRVIFIQDTI